MPYIGKSPTGSGVRQRYHYTATGGETSLSGADDNSKTLKFTDGEYVDVYLNGVLLVQGTDYGVGTANTISSLAALAANDIVEVIVYDIYNVAKINSEAVRSRHYFTATGGETSIGTSQISGLSFPANADIDVKLNGVTLVAGTDYNTTTANTVSGLTALTAGQVVEIVIYEKFQLADTVSKAAGGTFSGPVTFNSAISGLENTPDLVLQVVNVKSTAAQSTTSSTFQDTALTASITPSSTSSKILILANVSMYASTGTTQGSATVFRGDASGTNLGTALYGFGGAFSGGSAKNVISINYLDSPATTSSQTYTIGIASTDNSSSIQLNINAETSTLTLMEISA